MNVDILVDASVYSALPFDAVGEATRTDRKYDLERSKYETDEQHELVPRVRESNRSLDDHNYLCSIGLPSIACAQKNLSIK